MGKEKWDIKWFLKCSFLRLVCRCSKAAAGKNLPYFALQKFGVCVGLKSKASKTVDLFDERCFDSGFGTCNPEKEVCIGANEYQFVYETKGMLFMWPLRSLIIKIVIENLDYLNCYLIFLREWKINSYIVCSKSLYWANKYVHNLKSWIIRVIISRVKYSIDY